MWMAPVWPPLTRQDCADWPGWVPGVRMIIWDGQTQPGVSLEPAVGGDHKDGGWLEGELRGEDELAVIQPGPVQRVPQFSIKLHKQYLIWKLTYSPKFWNLSEVIEAHSLASGGYGSDRGQNEKKWAKIIKSPIFDSQKRNIPQKKYKEKNQ